MNSEPIALVLGLASLWFSAQALAINKCTGPGGSVSFQEAPCPQGSGGAIIVKPASGSTPASAAATTQQSSEGDRLGKLAEGMGRARQLWEMDNDVIPTAQRQLARHKQDCAEKIARIEQNMYIYEQNLYGKTHAAQMASEKAATATLCANRQRELEAVVDDARKKRDSMAAEAAK